MDSQSQTSFIPKKPIIQTGYSYENRGVSVVTIICVIIFFGAVGLSVGAYLYKSFLTTKIAAKASDLEKAKNSFDLDTVISLKRLGSRMEESRKLLNQHIAMSEVFKVLEAATIKQIRFTEMSLDIGEQSQSTILEGSQLPSVSDGIQFKARGVAKDYTSVALQSDVLNKTSGFREAIFSDLTRNQNGISFTVTAKIDKSIVNYRKAIENGTQ